MEGSGKFFWDDSRFYIGSFKDNCLCGYGVYTKGTKVHYGYFYNDKHHGLGVSYDNNTKLVGKWIEGVLSGLAIFYFKNDSFQIWQMINNKPKAIITDPTEIKEIQDTEEYIELLGFYTKVEPNINL